MKTFLLPFVALVTVACGKQVHFSGRANPVKMNVEQSLMPHVQRYLDSCEATKVKCTIYNLTVSYVEVIDGDAIGQCQISWINGKLHQTIVIERNLEENNLYIFLAHELEHCLRFQDHTKDTRPHVMRTFMLNNWEIGDKSLDAWVQESLLRDVRYRGYENY